MNIKHSCPNRTMSYIARTSFLMFRRNLSTGNEREKLKKKIMMLFKAENVFLFSSGTAALIVLLKKYINDNDCEILLPGFECESLTCAVKHLDAKVIYYAVNSDYSADENDIIRKISQKTVAIIVSHPFGVKNSFKKLKSVNIPIIEDCTHSLCQQLKNSECVFSMGATKLITSCEGGAVLTNKSDGLEMLRMYETNVFRLSDIHACIGRLQFDKLEEYKEKRRKIAAIYNFFFRNISEITLPDIKKYDAIYRYVLSFADGNIANNFVHYCKKKGIKCEMAMSIPKVAIGIGNIERICKRIVSIPIYPSLSWLSVFKIIYIVKSFFGNENKDIM